MGDTSEDCADDSVYRVEMFGGLRVYRPNEPPPLKTRFATEKTASLFAYLAYNVGRSQPRVALAEMFWPEKTPNRALRNLSQTLTFLRKQLKIPFVPEETLVKTDRQSVGLTNAFRTDVAERNALLKAARQVQQTSPELAADLFRQTVVIYGPGFLPEHYDDWVVIKQQEQAITNDEATIWLSQYTLRQQSHGTDIAERKRAIEANKNSENGGVDAQGAIAVVSWPQQPSGSSRNSKFPSLGEPPVFRPRSPIPPSGSRFFGRQNEISDVIHRLKIVHDRVITLTGAGGIGKTRLAREVLRTLQGDTAPGRHLFVDLSQSATSSEMSNGILAVLEKPTGLPLDAALEQIVTELSKIHFPVLLLDNCDRIVEEGAVWLQSLAARATETTLLLTSRTPMGIDGEQIICIDPLPLPDPDSDYASCSDEEIEVLVEESPSLQMYRDRARLVAPSFSISQRTIGDVLCLLHRLDGLPLAIELAAARARTWSTTRMLHYLNESPLDVLEHSGHKLEERHRSLRDTIRWSVERLKKPIRQAFAAVSVFLGSFSDDAAAAVLNKKPMQATKLLDRMVNASLVVAEESDDPDGKPQIRYRLLETIREYARELLTSDTRIESARNHAHYYFSFARKFEIDLYSENQERWFRAFREEYRNIRAALDLCVSATDNPLCSHEPLEPLAAAAALSRFWMVRGPLNEGRAYLEEFLSRYQKQAPPALLIKSLNAAGALASEAGDYEAARKFFLRVIWLTRPGGAAAGERGRAHSLGGYSQLAATAGDYKRAQRLAVQTIALLETDVKNKPTLPAAWFNLGAFSVDAGDWCEADRALNKSLILARESHDLRTEGSVLAYQGDLAKALGNLDAAETLYRQSLVPLSAIRDDWSCTLAVLCLAFLEQDRENIERAAWLGDAAIEEANRLAIPLPPKYEKRRYTLPALTQTSTRAISFPKIVSHLISGK